MKLLSILVAVCATLTLSEGYVTGIYYGQKTFEKEVCPSLRCYIECSFTVGVGDYDLTCLQVQVRPPTQVHQTPVPKKEIPVQQFIKIEYYDYYEKSIEVMYIEVTDCSSTDKINEAIMEIKPRTSGKAPEEVSIRVRKLRPMKADFERKRATFKYDSVKEEYTLSMP